MRKGLWFCGVATVCSLLIQRNASVGADKPACEPGYKIVEEICYKDIVKKVCKVVPDVKKTTKWVYDCKPVDFCVPSCHGMFAGGHGCGKCAGCLQCSHPMSKNVLIKRLVTEECPSEKCVIECVTERVCYTICRKVRCDEPAVSAPGAAAPKAEPLPPPNKSK